MVKRCFEVLTTIEDAENGHFIACNLEGNADAAPKTEDTQAGADIVPTRTSQGKAIQTFALLCDGICVPGRNLGRGCGGDLKEQG